MYLIGSATENAISTGKKDKINVLALFINLLEIFSFDMLVKGLELCIH